MVLTPSPLPGAEMITFFAPAFRCCAAFSLSLKIPVHSSTTSISSSFHGSLDGFFSAYAFMSLPLTTIAFSFDETSPSNFPWAVSYFNKWAKVALSPRSFMALISTPGLFSRFLKASLPIRPNPFIAIFFFLIATIVLL